MKKEILLLSSLISLAVVFYLGIPNKNITEKNESIVDKKSVFISSPPNESINEDVPLKFDIVRLDPGGDLIIAGKTKPNIIVDIYDGNLKLSSVTSDSHGDWVWMSEKQIDSGLKRFKLKHLNSKGEVINSDENIIIFFEKDKKEKQKVVKVKNKGKTGIEILNNNQEIRGLALDSAEHFDNHKLRLKGRSIPNAEIEIFLSKKLIGKSFTDLKGNWEFSINEIAFDTYNLEVKSIFENNIISLKTEILNGKVNTKLFYEKEIIVEDGNSLWRIARKTLGGGILYAEIYKNNKKIISDPGLIFPGQVFKIPNLKRASFYE